MDHISNNHHQPLWFRRKAKRLLDPPGPRIPRPDPISQDLTPKKVQSETPPLRRSQIVTTAVPSTKEPINVFPILCSTSSLRMSTQNGKDVNRFRRRRHGRRYYLRS